MLQVTRAGSAALAVTALLLGTACGSDATTPASSGAKTLRVSGSTTVNPVAADAAEELRRKEGLRITVDTQGGSAGGIAQLGAGEIDVAMSSKPVTEEDRRRHRGVDFVSTAIGQDAVGVVVRREVVDGGLRSVTHAQLRALFEGKVANWSELGGPDLAVFVYDKEPGRGTREVLDAFLYGQDGKAPSPPTTGRFAIVGGNEEARTKVLSTPGSVTPLSTAFVTGQPKLAVLAVDGVLPTPQSIGDGSYPMARPLLLVSDGAPAGPAKTFVDYLLSAKGQEVVRRHGYLALADVSQP